MNKTMTDIFARQQPDAQQQQQQQAQAQPGITATDLQTAFQAAIQAAQPAPPQPAMTPERFEQLTRAYKPDVSLVDLMFGEQASNETRLQALLNLVQGVVDNTSARADLLAQARLQEYHQQLYPDIEDLRDIAQSRFFDQLYDGHPGLKQYDPLLRQMIPQFEQPPNYPQERKQRPEFIRNQAVELIKKTMPTFDPKYDPAQQQQQRGSAGYYPAYQTQQQVSGATQMAPQRQSSPGLPSLNGGGQGAAAHAPAANGGNGHPLRYADPTGLGI